MTDQAQNPIWECHICDKLFKTMGGKNKHIKTKHEGKRYTCALCNKSYTSKTNLEKHLTTAVCSCSQKQSTEGKPPPPVINPPVGSNITPDHFHTLESERLSDTFLTTLDQEPTDVLPNWVDICGMHKNIFYSQSQV